MVSVGAIVGLVTLTLGPTTAGAVVGGTSTADAADVTVVSAPLGLNVSGGTASVSAPAANGTTNSGANVTMAAPVAVTTTAATATATRGATSVSATSSIATTATNLLGGAVTAGIITSAVDCPLTGAPTASASAADVVIGGTAVTVVANAAAVTGTITITSPLFTNGTASVTVLADSRAATTATTADAFGLRLRFAATADIPLVAGGVIAAGTSLGEIRLAETNCTAPTGPDVVPTTAGPTTVAPTTAAPTTAAPTTAAPTTTAPLVVVTTTTPPTTFAPVMPTFPPGGQLPATGSSTTIQLLVAVGLLAIGSTLIIAGRRRTA